MALLRESPFVIQLVAVWVLAAFARVALAANSVHRNRQRFVRFLADRAVGHGAALEAFDDRFDRLDLVDGNRLLGKLEVQQRRAAYRISFFWSLISVEYSLKILYLFVAARHIAACGSSAG